MSGIKRGFLAGVALPALLGPMTAAERQNGRYMRAPDGHGDEAFREFAEAGEVEVGSSGDPIETNVETPADEKPEPKKSGKGPRAKAVEKPAEGDAEKPADDEKPADGEKPDDDEPGDEEGDEGEEEKPEKPARKTSDRIKELTGRNRAQGRLIEQLSSRLEALEKGGLPAGGNSGTTAATGKAEPDPSDKDASGNALYPLGHLDDRYIEDKLDWLAEEKAAKRADAVLLRQQEDEQRQAAERSQAQLLEKVDDLRTRGSEISDDFEETVIEGGLKGAYPLEQATFEAAHEAENGAQILYELSQDKKEAARVAGLSPFQQMKFVIDRDAEISLKARPRTKPRAGEPPSTTTRGANSSHRINPATDDLVQFEKAWVADAKGK